MTQWRVIGFSRHGGAHNMAIDESICNSVRTGEQPPTIRFYGWDPSCISLGYFQSADAEVDLRRCESAGVDVVRRMTGGGAVFHTTMGELTYSVVAPEGLFAKGVLESYAEICGWMITGFSRLGLRAQFRPVNDILIGGRKVSGNAQTRRGGVLVQHGTILLSVDVDEMFSLLKVPDEKLRDKFVVSARQSVTSLTEQCALNSLPAPTIESVQQAMFASFVEGKDWVVGQVSQKELESAEALARQKYASKEWNFMR